ncbi:MAG: Blue (Type 1) copper protein [Chloroflexi bacterium]|nr:Blue (Type 1) copper protein [Chloroflexota bacterium]
MKRLKNFRWAGLLGAGTVILALFLAVFTLQPGAVSAQATPATMNITIQGFAFSPNTITIPVGTKVIWTNKDTVGHTVTSDSGGVLNSPLIAQNQTFEYTFTTAGTFNYHCAPHPNMKANIVVTAATGAPSSSAPNVPATGIGGTIGPDSQTLLLWIIPLAALSVITLLALAVRRRTHR